jgi:hypothetical protein
MSKQTLRSKVEEFFNPGPVGSLALDNDGADSNDEHIKSYFKPKSEARQELPKRKIVAEIDIDPKFSAKAVSRADLERQSSEESGSYASEDEYGEEEMNESDASSEISEHVRP